MHGMWTVSKMAEDCVSTTISRIGAVLCVKARSTNELAAPLAQLVERQSHNLKVAQFDPGREYPFAYLFPLSRSRID